VGPRRSLDAHSLLSRVVKIVTTFQVPPRVISSDDYIKVISSDLTLTRQLARYRLLLEGWVVSSRPSLGDRDSRTRGVFVDSA
jgi:hypothetical protein